MARAQSTDFLHSMRFHVSLVNQAGGDIDLGTGSDPSKQGAGFSNVSTPEMSIEAVEYKEGNWVYQRKFPGNPTMGGDLTMSRGVTRGDSTFWDWGRRTAEGSGEYRADLQIQHFHRDTSLTRAHPAQGTVNLTRLDVAKPARTYHVYQAFPTRVKVAADMDATASEISIQELDVAYENFEVEEHSA